MLEIYSNFVELYIFIFQPGHEIFSFTDSTSQRTIECSLEELLFFRWLEDEHKPLKSCRVHFNFILNHSKFAERIKEICSGRWPQVRGLRIQVADTSFHLNGCFSKWFISSLIVCMLESVKQYNFEFSSFHSLTRGVYWRLETIPIFFNHLLIAFQCERYRVQC